MYKNAGKSLKRYVSTLIGLLNLFVIVMCILSIIAASTLLGELAWLFILITLAVTAISLFLIRVLCVGVYAFGEIADQTLQIRKIMEGKAPDSDDEENVPAPVVEKNEWKCVYCGFINDTANDGCIKCGKRRA